jgi:hypothetical protein
MVTDAQVRLMRQTRMDGKTQAAAAAASSMSLRTAREWDTGPVPSATKQSRDWRTRPDPFAAVWLTDVEPLLRSDAKGVLEAKWVLEVLRTRYPEQFHPGQARTLQRRFREWRARHGVEPEVFFQQVAVPGREAAIDFTHATDLGVTIAGDPFPHLLFEFVLSYSHWTWVAIAFGETFEALAAGVQGALWALGGVPAVLRSDNLSAATHELKASSGRDLTPRFRAVLEHYDMRSSRITPGRAHENGIAEQAHRRLKALLAQALLVRGHAAFDDVTAYDAFVQEVVAYWRNRPAAARLAEERPAFRALPSAPIPSYTCYYPVVRRWSTIRVAHRTYSVPAQLMGHTVEARVHPNVVEVRYRDQIVQTMPRLRKEDEHRIDYPPCDRLVGAQAWSLCALPVSRGPVSLDHIPAGVRRVGPDAWRARRRRVPADLAPGRDRRRSAGDRGPCADAGSSQWHRLRRGADPRGAAGADRAGDLHSGAGPLRL